MASMDSSPLSLDMSRIYQAERRLHDLAIVTPGNAPEFMGEMNASAHITMNHVSEITRELIFARQALDRRKAVVILEVLPEKLISLKDRGIKANEDIREAILATDNEYMGLRDRVECLEAASIHLDNKVKSFVRAFNAARSIMERKSSMGVNPTLTPGPNPFDVKKHFAGHNISDREEETDV